MEGVEIHNASPISSDSSKDGAVKQWQKPLAPVRPPLGTHKTSWTSYMIREDSEPSSSFSSSGSGSASASGSGKSGSSAKRDVVRDVQTTNHKNPTTDTVMEDVPPIPESDTTRIPTTQTEEPVETNPTSTSDIQSNTSTITTNAPQPQPQSQPELQPQPLKINNPNRRSITRLHTRSTSISATMDLPWNIDNTSSPYTPNSHHHHRNSSFGIPPPPRAGGTSRHSSNSSYSSSSASESPKLHPLQTRVATFYNGHQAPSPYTSISTTRSDSIPESNLPQNAPFNFDFPNYDQNQAYSPPQPQPQFQSPPQQRPPFTHSLTSPPGYTQNPHAHTPTHTSISSSNTTSTSHKTPATSISISTAPLSPSRRSSTYSNYSPHDTSAPPLYTSNTSPLYQNTTTQNTSSYGYNSTLFSPSFSFSAPKTPTPKKMARAGILDNDPDMYLTRSQSSGAERDEDGSIWDAATKWMRSTSKKLSLGGENNSSGGGGVGRPGEYSVSGGLWKMVGGGGGDKRDGY